MLALALAASTFSGVHMPGQAPAARLPYRGAILVQTMDTSINPLAAEVVLPAFGLGVRLSEEGAAILLNIPDGIYLVQARHLGYRPEWRVARITGDTAHIDFVLPPAERGSGADGTGLAESRLRAFLRRAGAIHVGSFVTRVDIERRRPRNLASVLSRVPDVAIDRDASGPTVARSARATGPGCAKGMLLFVDGMLPEMPTLENVRAPTESEGNPRSLGGLRAERWTLGGSRASGDGSRWAAGTGPRPLAGSHPEVESEQPRTRRSSALDWVPISLVAGLEVYPSVSDVPPEFQVAGAECGVVLVWTIRR
jgi:hypothetical protein